MVRGFNLFSYKISISALEPTEPPLGFFPGGVKFAANRHLLSSLRMSGTTPPHHGVDRDKFGFQVYNNMELFVM